ncbi:MAG: UDP-N-acetylmuramoyl-tripeptide--D-alanyl-D-alanine ligase [Thermodesulfobacteriota bacterium]
MKMIHGKRTWTAIQLAKAVAGELFSGNPRSRFSGISIDSRRISPGQIFVAIVGEKHDGHTFISNVISQGISGVILQKDRLDKSLFKRLKTEGVCSISTADTTRGLGDLAAFYRRKLRTGIVAVTGSNGKTTTRRMTAEVMAQKFITHSAAGNFNNEIGLPLTLLELSPEHQWGVVELGMNHPGEIRRLSDICLPNIGVITNIAPAHLEGVGSLEGVVNAKGELLENIIEGGTAVLNADDPNVARLAERTGEEVLFFGFSGKAAVRAVSVREQKGKVKFNLVLPGASIPVTLRIPGRFMVSNALAAAAVGFRLGISPEKIKTGLESLTSIPGRMNMITLNCGIHIIDDTYNANPGSMKAAVEFLSRLKKYGRSIFVGGDMLELGEASAELHRKLGEQVASSGINRLYITGKFSDSVAEGARKKGLNLRNIRVGSKEFILKDLIIYLRPGDRVLVKGSRGMAMEEVVKGLMEFDEKELRITHNRSTVSVTKSK